MTKMRTLFDKVWDDHIVAQEEDETLLYVDRCLIHEGSRHTFDTLHERGLSVANPNKVFAFSDHYIPTDPQARTRGVASIPDPEIRNMVELLIRNTDEYKITRFGWGDDRQGILHVAGPELGLTQPGIVLVGANSHTSTHGAFGNLSFGIGASETTHVVATQTIWQRRPSTLRNQDRWTARFWCHRQGHYPRCHRQDRHRRRDRLCDRICRLHYHTDDYE